MAPPPQRRTDAGLRLREHDCTSDDWTALCGISDRASDDGASVGPASAHGAPSSSRMNSSNSDRYAHDRLTQILRRRAALDRQHVEVVALAVLIDHAAVLHRQQVAVRVEVLNRVTTIAHDPDDKAVGIRNRYLRAVDELRLQRGPTLLVAHAPAGARG